MYKFEVVSNSDNYNVAIGANFAEVVDEFDFIVADDFLQPELSPQPNVMFVNANELNKNLAQVEQICERFRAHGLTRSATVLAVGGGVIQDLVTLAASLYMRGISWAYMPTTMTGMMDSCLGGKSSINVGTTKNLVGNVYPPSNIFVDTTFSRTLDPQSLVSGLAEGVKICFARGNAEFVEFCNNSASSDPADNQATKSLINHTLTTKKWFIEIDEFDKKERQLLNFGHSFGHAFEAACGFSVQHGVGVALGMLAAIDHPLAARTQSSAALHAYTTNLLAPLRDEIERATTQADWELFERSLASDKKNTPDSLVLILPGQTEMVERVEIPFNSGSIKQASAAMRNSLNTLISRQVSR
jgi:3-dehydroquinate synthase